MKVRSVLVVLACGAIVAAGCGSKKSSTTGATTTAAAVTTAAPAATTAAPAATTAAAPAGDAGVKASTDLVAKALIPPTAIGVTKPLTSKPAKKTLAWVECEVPSCAEITPGFKAATTALGWDLKIISGKSAEPGPAIQQAIDAGANYIAITGSPLALYKAQADAAKAKGIPIFSCYSTDDPDLANNNLGMQCGDELAVTATGGTVANWVVADSKGAANVLGVTIRDFPVLVTEEDAFKAVLTKNCTKCTLDVLNVTIDDLVGGKIPAAIASKLQANTKLNYVYFTFGDLPLGVPDALKSASLLDKVKLVGVDFNKGDLTDIVSGAQKAWTANPKVYAGWLMTDAAARLSVGMKLDEERAAAALPTFIVQDAKAAQALIDAGGNWAGPAGMEASFKKLWGV